LLSFPKDIRLYGIALIFVRSDTVILSEAKNPSISPSSAIHRSFASLRMTAIGANALHSIGKTFRLLPLPCCHSRRESAAAFAVLVVIPEGNPLLWRFSYFCRRGTVTLSEAKNLSILLFSGIQRSFASLRMTDIRAKALHTNRQNVPVAVALLSFPKGICRCLCGSCCHSRRESASMALLSSL
jgi:hypothetical protein